MQHFNLLPPAPPPNWNLGKIAKYRFTEYTGFYSTKWVANCRAFTFNNSQNRRDLSTDYKPWTMLWDLDLVHRKQLLLLFFFFQDSGHNDLNRSQRARIEDAVFVTFTSGFSTLYLKVPWFLILALRVPLSLKKNCDRLLSAMAFGVIGKGNIAYQYNLSFLHSTMFDSLYWMIDRTVRQVSQTIHDLSVNPSLSVWWSVGQSWRRPFV